MSVDTSVLRMYDSAESKISILAFASASNFDRSSAMLPKTNAERIAST